MPARDLVLQLLFVVVALWMVFGGLHNELLDAVGLTTLIRFVVPVALLYFWLHFGLGLDDLMKTRAAAWRPLGDWITRRPRVSLQ